MDDTENLRQLVTEFRPGKPVARRARLMRRASAFVLSVGLLTCAQPTSAPQTTAQAFVDKFFVEANQRAALPLTEGVAQAKLEEELRSLGDQPASNPEERPRVYYRQVSEQTQDDGMTFRFRLTVVIVGDPPIEPELIVRVRPRGNQWRVSNYEVLPLPAAAAAPAT